MCYIKQGRHGLVSIVDPSMPSPLWVWRLLNKLTEGRRKMFIIRQLLTQHLLNPFPSPFFENKFIYDYGF